MAFFEPTRGGTRGGQADFKWSDVKEDEHRENYLGHSINAPKGRWQNNKDITWYLKDKNGSKEAEEQARQDEIKALKQAEEEALAKVLGYVPISRESQNSEGSKLTEQEKEVRRAEKAQRKAERDLKRSERQLRKEDRDRREGSKREDTRIDRDSKDRHYKEKSNMERDGSRERTRDRDGDRDRVRGYDRHRDRDRGRESRRRDGERDVQRSQSPRRR